MSHARAVGSILQNLRSDANGMASGKVREMENPYSRLPAVSGTQSRNIWVRGERTSVFRPVRPPQGKAESVRKPVKRSHEKESDTFKVCPGQNSAIIKKKKMFCSKDEFFCTLCSVECSSQIVLDTHLAGKKHRRSVEKLKDCTKAFHQSEVPLEKGDMIADIQEGFNELSLSEPLVGLEYVTEYQRQNRKHRYFCEICCLKSNYEFMLEHVISRQHRLRFMRTHCFDIYYKITDYPSFENVMLPSEADKLLRQHSGFVFRRLLKGKIRLCQVKQYKGEENMKVDIQSHQELGKIHPSQHHDLPLAENILEEKEAVEKEKQALKNRIIPAAESYEGSLYDGGKSMCSVSKAQNVNSVLHSSQNDLAVRELLELELLEKEILRSRLRQKRLHELDEQERRIVSAIRKLQRSINGGGMTREEAIADEKLTMLLGSIRAEKRRLNVVAAKTRSIGLEVVGTQQSLHHRSRLLLDQPGPSSSAISEVRHVPQHNASNKEQYRVNQLSTEQKSSVRTSRKSPGEISCETEPSISDIRKVVEPIIEETRQKIEDKIFEALNSGTMSSLIDNLKRNPDLQASLKQWELQQACNAQNAESPPSSGNKEGTTCAPVHKTECKSGLTNRGAVIKKEESSTLAQNMPMHSAAPVKVKLEPAGCHGVGSVQSEQESSVRINELKQSDRFVNTDPCDRKYHKGQLREQHFSPLEPKPSAGLLGSRPQFSGRSGNFQRFY